MIKLNFTFGFFNSIGFYVRYIYLHEYLILSWYIYKVTVPYIGPIGINLFRGKMANGKVPFRWGPLNNQPYRHLISRRYLMGISPSKGLLWGGLNSYGTIPKDTSFCLFSW